MLDNALHGSCQLAPRKVNADRMPSWQRQIPMPRSTPDSPLPYGQQRARHITFGSAEVRVVPGLDWEALREQSQLAERTREVNLELG
jgi:hypothetical protein